MQRHLSIFAIVSLFIILVGCEKQDSSTISKLNNLENKLAEISIRIEKNFEINSYDDCIISNMKNSTIFVSAVSIKESCIQKFSAILPDSVTDKILSTGVLPYGIKVNEDGYIQFNVNLNNLTEYRISEVSFLIKNKNFSQLNSYIVNKFYFPEILGVIVSKGPDDPTIYNFIDKGLRDFIVKTNIRSPDASKFFQEHEIMFRANKGFL